MSRHPKLLGLDIGFGFTKCVDGTRTVIFQSQLQPDDQALRQAAGAPSGVYAIALDERCYRVGADASGPSFWKRFARRPDRLIGEYAKALALTAAAHFSEGECPFQMVVGLPVSQAPHWQSALAAQLDGFHKIGVTLPDGEPIRRNLHIRKVHVVPQPMGTFSGLVMDRHGRFRQSDYRAAKVALIDIGFRTTDVMVMDAGRFCRRSSVTIDMGMADGFEDMARRIYRKSQFMPDLADLYRAIRLGFIRIEDQEYNLRSLRDETYRHVSAALADIINHHLRDDWDLEKVLLTGGGAPDLAEDLGPRLHGDVILIEHEQDGRLNNAEGHLCLARHMWGASGFCNHR